MKSFSELRNNWAAQPYRGYYVNRDGKPESLDSLELISHVVDNFYVGGCVNKTDVEDYFTHIFSVYQWERYACDDSTVLRAYEMYDSHDGLDVEAVEHISDKVVDALATGGNVLVHCQAGINRSNLVAARVLMKKYRMSAAEAIAELEDTRSPLVLSNSVFKNWLLGLDSVPSV